MAQLCLERTMVKTDMNSFVYSGTRTTVPEQHSQKQQNQIKNRTTNRMHTDITVIQEIQAIQSLLNKHIESVIGL